HSEPWRWRELVARELSLAPAVHEVPVREAAGRVLASAVRSAEDVPAVAVSAMDGFAVRRADLRAHAPSRLPVAMGLPTRLRALATTRVQVEMDLPSRVGVVRTVDRGSAARIMTGAPAPAGADLVVEVEATDVDPRGAAPAEVVLTPRSLPDPMRHVRGPGEEIARGAVLAQAGDRVGAGLVGLACTLGIPSLPVHGAGRVGAVITGDELVDAPAGAGADEAAETADEAPGAVRESNGAMLAAALEADGCAVRILRSGDDPAQLEGVLDEAADSADLVLTTGGIGHGAYDVVKELL